MIGVEDLEGAMSINHTYVGKGVRGGERNQWHMLRKVERSHHVGSVGFHEDGIFIYKPQRNVA